MFLLTAKVEETELSTNIQVKYRKYSYFCG